MQSRLKKQALVQLKPIEAPLAQPFLKWVGGKNQLLPQFQGLYPKKFNRYFEPFVGGGAVFFEVHQRFTPSASVLTDMNAELINCYQQIQQNVETLIEDLQTHHYNSEYYYAVRALDPNTLTPLKRASRFIFLNKTCFNGLYRVNKKGAFNVPMGRYQNPTICAQDNLRRVNRVLNQNVTLAQADFTHVLNQAEAGDFIYFDPPYVPLNKTASFTSYTAGDFGMLQQELLRDTFKELAQRGCYVMLSNSDTPIVRELYQEFRLIEVQANRHINSKATHRGKISELVVMSY